MDMSREWYRYEHLFAELLRHRLDLEFGKDAAHELQIRASCWYEEHELHDDAIKHALTARDWGRVLRLLEYAVPRKERRGELITVIGWMNVVPADILLSNPHVYCTYGKCLGSSGQPDAAEAVLKNLEPLARQDIQLQGKIAIGWMAVATSRGNIEQAIEHARKALSFLPAVEVVDRGYASCVLALNLTRKGDFLHAEYVLKETLEAGRQTDDHYTVAFALTWLCVIAYFRGRLREACAFCQQAMKLVPQSPALAQVVGYLGLILYQWNDLELALSHLEQANELNRHGTLADTQEWIYTVLARIYLAMGDDRRVLEVLEKIDLLVQHTGSLESMFRGHTISLHVNMALKQGNLDEAVHWGDKFPEYRVDVNKNFVHTAAARFHLLLALKGKAAAAAFLEEIYPNIPAEMDLDRLGVRILQAEATENLDRGMTFLAEALSMAKPESIIRPFANEGMVLAPLLKKAISQGIEPEFADRLHQIIETETHPHFRGGELIPAALLSERELEVLTLIAKGLTNQQIAEKLIISLSTVKSHVYHIFSKLDAQDRLQAVIRAQELKLL